MTAIGWMTNRYIAIALNEEIGHAMVFDAKFKVNKEPLALLICGVLDKLCVGGERRNK